MTGGQSLISKSQNNLKKGINEKKKSLQNLNSNSKSKTSVHSNLSIPKTK